MIPQKTTIIRFQSKSLDDLRTNRRCRQQSIDDKPISIITRTEMNLSTIGCNDNYAEINENSCHDDETHDLRRQRCHSAPGSPTKINDKELTMFIQCGQKSMTDSFVYNVDLSDTNKAMHQSHSRTSVLFVCLMPRISCLF